LCSGESKRLTPPVLEKGLFSLSSLTILPTFTRKVHEKYKKKMKNIASVHHPSVSSSSPRRKYDRKSFLVKLLACIMSVFLAQNLLYYFQFASYWLRQQQTTESNEQQMNAQQMTTKTTNDDPTSSSNQKDLKTRTSASPRVDEEDSPKRDKKESKTNDQRTLANGKKKPSSPVVKQEAPNEKEETSKEAIDIDSLERKVVFDGATILWGTPVTASSADDDAGKDVLFPLSANTLKRLDDHDVDLEAEKKRCERYGFEWDSKRTTRRRIFWGSLIANDSFRVLQAVGTEGRNLFHSVSFVESNTTGTLSTRPWRFLPGSSEWNALAAIFGEKTHVTVDYYIDGPTPARYINREHQQRQAVLERWKRNGMKTDDLAFFGDTDEMFTRDFLRALQICDVPEFRPGQDCKAPKIMATGLIFESSPECVINNAKLWHPDVLIGECVDGIGDANNHPPPLRVHRKNQSYREEGHGYDGSYEKYFKANPQAAATKQYPLWNAGDMRRIGGGRQNQKVKQNGFHLHNFFMDKQEIRNKYLTYAEAVEKADMVPLSLIHDDLSVAVACVHGWQNLGERKLLMGGYTKIQGPTPILFDDPEFRKLRHEELKQIILSDEKIYDSFNATCESVQCKGCTNTRCAGFDIPGPVLRAIAKLEDSKAGKRFVCAALCFNCVLPISLKLTAHHIQQL
jgi:cytoskeletal protein RodZ